MLYLGRGKGGLYEKVLQAISDRKPKLNLKIRRGPMAVLANSIIAEAKTDCAAPIFFGQSILLRSD
jgi:hypothetical protein